MATSHFVVSASANIPGVFCVLRLQGRLRSGLLGHGLSRAQCGQCSAVSVRHGDTEAHGSNDRGGHSMWPEVDHQGLFKLRAQTTLPRSSASAAAFSALRPGSAGRCLRSVASSGVSERPGAGADMSLSLQGTGFDEASDACRLTCRMQRTVKSFTQIAFAICAPLFPAADARR
jgi:hypothetical protein